MVDVTGRAERSRVAPWAGLASPATDARARGRSAAARAARGCDLLRGDRLHPVLLLLVPRAGVVRGGRLRRAALAGPRRLRRRRRLPRGDAVERAPPGAV